MQFTALEFIHLNKVVRRVFILTFILVFFGSNFLVADLTINLPETKTLRPNQTPIIIDRHARFHPINSSKGMVVSQEAIASRVGAKILSDGGNAIDAAVATGFALAVTLPQAGNLGGGGFMLLHLAESDQTLAIDYREMAPLAVNETLFIDEQGEVDTQLARFSTLSTGVPGTVAGLIHVLERYGTMELEQVIAPAIKLAKKGIEVNAPLAFSLNRAKNRLKRNRASARYFFNPDGKPLQQGDLWQQKDLANTLQIISDKGKEGFYKGSIADMIIAEIKHGNGVMTHEDLANYRVVERKPVIGTYKGYTIASMPPPSSGGVHLIQMLNILEGWDLKQLGHNSGAYLHRLIETMRRAYADRSQYLGDPDFFPVPVSILTDKAYAAKLRGEIETNRASISSQIKPGVILPKESPQTTHFSVWDSAGNVVSNTYTLNFSYGNGIAVEGAGFLLNNEMDDFSAKPGVPNAYGLIGDEANAIEPRKRPLSSMTPTIVFKDLKAKEPVMATGSPGGSTIITIVLQNILNHLEFGMNIAEATAAPRIHHQWLPNEVYVEPGINKDTIQVLKAIGHKIQNNRRVLGRIQAISSEISSTGLKNSHLSGASDTRWPGGEATPSD